MSWQNLIHACEKEHVYCACIMTGYGTYTLKQQIPRWLVQHPRVRALHQHPKNGRRCCNFGIAGRLDYLLASSLDVR